MEKFVLYLDIMGFKERVNNTPISKLKQQLDDFKEKDNRLKPLLKGKDDKILMEMAQFSDSIVLVSTDNKLCDLNRICKAAAILMQIALKTGFALRGAIAKGEMIFDENNKLFFGKALVDAYLLEEELCYYGIVFHESTEEIVERFLEKGVNKSFIIEEYSVPFKKGRSKHFHIAWHKMNETNQAANISETAKGWLKALRKTVSGNPRVYLDNTINMIESSE